VSRLRPTRVQYEVLGKTMATATQTPWLNVKQAAEYLGVSASFVKQRVSRNEIPHRHLGRAVRIHVDELDAWADSKPGVRAEALV